MQGDVVGNSLKISSYIHQAMEAAKPTLIDYTYPLCIANQNNCPEIIGSAFFLKVDEKKYLVTAAHVIEDFFKEKSLCHVGLKSIVPLEKEFICSSKDGYDDLDIAFCSVDDGFLLKYKVNVITTEQAYASNKSMSPYMYLAHGYPCVKNNYRKFAKKKTKTLKINSFTYSGKEVAEKMYRIHKMKRDIHIGLEYKKSRDAKGNIQRPHAPQGVSGGGCWAMPSMFSPAKVFLAGMFINDKKSAIYSVKIDSIIDFIRKNA